MAPKKKNQGGNTKIIGGNLIKASGGGAVATDNARLAMPRARQVTDSAMASFGRSIGPYAMGAAEGGQMTMYEPFDPYAGVDYSAYDQYGAEVYDPAYYDEYAFDSMYDPGFYEDPYYGFDEYAGIGDDDLGIISTLPASTTAAQPETGFWSSLIGNLGGGVSGGVDSTAGSISQISASVGNLIKSINDAKAAKALTEVELARLKAEAKGGSGGKKSLAGSLLPIAAIGGGAYLLMKMMKR